MSSLYNTAQPPENADETMRLSQKENECLYR